MLSVFLIYVVGFLLTLIFLKFWGKQLLNVDYDNDHDYDDWSSNAEAFTFWSIGWFVFIPMLTMRGIFILVKKFLDYKITLKKNEQTDN